jgi:hypothetical protein
VTIDHWDDPYAADRPSRLIGFDDAVEELPPSPSPETGRTPRRPYFAFVAVLVTLVVICFGIALYELRGVRGLHPAQNIAGQTQPAAGAAGPAAETKKPAEESKQTTEAAKQTTEAAKQTTEAAKQTTEAAQQTTVAAQQAAEAAKQTTEAAQQAAETAKQTTEAAQQTAAPAKQTTEAARQTAATAKQAAETAQQATAIAQQATATAKRTVAAGERAQVKVDEVAVRRIAGPGFAYWTAAPVAQNGGNTPTKDLRFTSAWGFKKPKGHPSPLSDADAAARHLLPAAIAPHAGIDLPGPSMLPQAAGKTIYLHGLVYYNDTLSDDRHVTQFCFFLHIPRTVAKQEPGAAPKFARCPDANCTDQECANESEAKQSAARP